MMCSFAYDYLPLDARALAGKMPTHELTDVRVDVTWPGDYTCTWLDPDGATYTVPVILALRIAALNWPM